MLLVIAIAIGVPSIADSKIPFKNCLSEAEIVEQLPQLREHFSHVAVLRISSEEDLIKFKYQTLPPILKGDLPLTGLLNGDSCNKEIFQGDIVLVFGSVSQFGFDIGYSIKLYSQQWDLIWSEESLQWIESEYGARN